MSAMVRFTWGWFFFPFWGFFERKGEKHELTLCRFCFSFSKRKNQVVVLKKFAPPEVVEKVVNSAAAARAGKRPHSAAGPALAKKKG